MNFINHEEYNARRKKNTAFWHLFSNSDNILSFSPLTLEFNEVFATHSIKMRRDPPPAV
jgi:hypothetical protein